jgi:serine/threonine-protein kinase RsbW
MRSCVAVNPEEEFVGHLAMMVEHPDSVVGEAGQAVVDPRFRGHNLCAGMKTFLAEEAKKHGMYGLYSEATTVHPYSQKGNLHLGAGATGFLLSYIPASVSYKQSNELQSRRRGSVAMFYMQVNEESERYLYPPARYGDVIQRLVEHNGLQRSIVADPDAEAQEEMPPSSRMSVRVCRDHYQASLRVTKPGTALREQLR